MNALGAVTVVIASMLASVLAVVPAAAADDYEPGVCIRNGPIGPEPFVDVSASAFYGAPVAWSYANRIVNGTDPDRFSPDQPLTRGQLAAILHRSVCAPPAGAEASFADLRPGAFYLDAVDWLVAEGLTTGVTPTEFGPELTVTRGQFATFLWRMVGEPGAAPSTFGDVPRNAYYAGAVDWLVRRGITTGTSPTTFEPGRPLTRGEAVTFLYRLNTIGDVQARFTTVLSGLDRPTAAVQRPGSGTWFITEQGGRLVKWDGGGGVDPVLTLAVSRGNEQGLLGLAFSPDGGRLYLHSTNGNGDSVVEERRMFGDLVLPEPPRVILVVDQPATNHNGGQLAFGPDGYLYIGLGDGGGANDTYGNGQNTTSLLGAILRIDPSTPSPPREYSNPEDNPFFGPTVPGWDQIWLYGVRNPWRFSFDQETGDLWVADVGQDAREEITRLAGPEFGRGANLGWPLREGTIATPGVGGPPPPGAVGPVHDYTRAGSPQSITGGYVYRGDAIPGLDGTYLWADFFAGTLMGWRDAYGVESEPITGIGGQPTSFAQDADGEVYVLTRDGSFRKLVAG